MPVYTHKESAMYIPSLEARLSSNDKSPVFARLASYYLQEGQLQRAMDICLSGLKHHPNYASAHLVLGKCYEAMGRNIEAMLEYQRALKAVPDNRTVTDLLKTVEQREQETFRKFSEERTKTLKDRDETVTFDQYAVEGSPSKETTADFLLRRLQDVKKSAPTAAPVRTGDDETSRQKITPSKIVTATLAEIYATQGEYKEAIEAYRKLVSQRPVESERYTKRIAQLEELSRTQQTEHQE